MERGRGRGKEHDSGGRAWDEETMVEKEGGERKGIKEMMGEKERGTAEETMVVKEGGREEEAIAVQEKGNGGGLDGTGRCNALQTISRI